MCECMHSAHHKPMQHTITLRLPNQEDVRERFEINGNYYLFRSLLHILLLFFHHETSRLLMGSFLKMNKCQTLHYLLKHGADPRAIWDDHGIIDLNERRMEFNLPLSPAIFIIVLCCSFGVDMLTHCDFVADERERFATASVMSCVQKYNKHLRGLRDSLPFTLQQLCCHCIRHHIKRPNMIYALNKIPNLPGPLKEILLLENTDAVQK